MPVTPKLHASIYDHTNLLIAVSGGSDSLALLHALVEKKHKKQRLTVATVDHGLRRESYSEAVRVGQICVEMGLPHSILKWQPTSASSQSARLGRYELLAKHAVMEDATAIVLGHNLNDQAETLMMRALRNKADSSTRGFSAMGPSTAYGQLKLLRPLLHSNREDLQTYLRSKNVGWIEDPSNEKLESERVRLRKFLQQSTSNSPADIDQIARLAQLSARHRIWLNHHAAQIIEHETSWDQAQPNTIVLNSGLEVPHAVLSEVFSTLIWLCGGLDYRSAQSKFADVVLAYRAQKPLRKAAGRTLINVRKQNTQFCREMRNIDANFTASSDDQQFTPTLRPFELFRPQADDAVFAAVQSLLQRQPIF